MNKNKNAIRDEFLKLVDSAAEYRPLAESIETVDEGIDIEPAITPALNLDKAFPFLRDAVHLISPSTLAPDEFIATSMLASMSAAIGTRAFVKLGRRTFYPNIGAMLIASSSDTFKSTAIRESKSFPLRKDREFQDIYKRELEEHAIALRKYESLPKKDRAYSDPPTPPIRKEIVFSDDETIESFYQTLADNPDGGLLAFDEIGSWLEGFDRYQGKGEMRRWLSIYDNAPVKYKRKVDKTHLIIDRPFVSIIGGITPNTFTTFFNGVKDIENGFLPRFIFCKNPRLTKKDNSFLRPDVDPAKWIKLFEIYEAVMELKTGEAVFNDEGMKIINAWYMEHIQEKNDPFFPDELHPFWRRLEGYLLKFALIGHQFKRASGEVDTNEISLETLGQALFLIDYYKGQARAVVGSLCKGKEGRTLDDLMAVIHRLGEGCTTREIMRAKRFWQGKAAKLKDALEQLQRSGLILLEEYRGQGMKDSSQKIKKILKNMMTP